MQPAAGNPDSLVAGNISGAGSSAVGNSGAGIPGAEVSGEDPFIESTARDLGQLFTMVRGLV